MTDLPGAARRESAAGSLSPEAEALLGAVIDGIAEATLVLDDAAGIIAANRAAATLAGAARGASLVALVPDAQRGEVERWWVAARDGRTGRATWRLRATGGPGARELEVAVRANVAPGRHLATVRDLTEQRSMERRLRAAQRMEVVGQLTGGLAHDFNNLLTVVLANVSLLEEQEGNAASPELAAIRAAAHRGADLVRKLLAFSQQEKLKRESVRLGAVVAEHARLLRRLLPASIDLRLEDEGLEEHVHVDPGALAQMMLGLATNARDAMPEGGTLTLHTHRLHLDLARCEAQGWGQPGHYVVLTVRDTGVGMEDSVRQRAFEPFFTTKKGGAATGLGLSVVYGLMKQHDGFVGIESVPGHGTAVHLVFPPAEEITGEHATPAPAAGARAPAGGGETILLAEDETLIRLTARRILERSGYRVLAAADGAEALELYAANRDAVRLVLTDVVMPNVSGPELLARLRSAGYAGAVLCTSGYTDRDLATRERLDADVPFIHKPWTSDDLLRRVRELLDALAR